MSWAITIGFGAFELANYFNKLHKDSCLLACHNKAWTIHKLEILASRIEEQLNQLGIDARTPVSTVFSHESEFVAIAFALSHMRQITPINPELKLPEQRVQMALANTSVLLTDDAEIFKNTNDAFAILMNVEGHVINHKTHDISHSKALQPLDGLILFTSGSTGPQKPIILSLDILYKSAQNIALSLELNKNDTALHCLPMFHICGFVDLLLAPMLAGGKAYHVNAKTPIALCHGILESNATWLQAVPTIMAQMANELTSTQWQSLSKNLKFVRCVSSSLAPNLQSQLEKMLCGVPIIQMYGMTESAGQICTNPLPPAVRKLGSVGRLSIGELAIRNEIGEECLSDEIGQIWLRSPLLCVDANFKKNGWFDTGDVGYIDEDGYLFLTGRSREMINRGGEKISPFEIENAALSHPNVIDAVAYGYPHPSLGELVGLAVITKHKKQTELDALEQHLKLTLAAFKLPRKIQVVNEMPKLASGKINRKELSQRHKAEQQEINIDPPKDELEVIIRDAWQRTLKTPLQSLSDDFFDRGGDSLSASQLILEIEGLSGAQLGINQLYETPDYKSFLTAVTKKSISEPPKPILSNFNFLENQMSKWPYKKHPQSQLISIIQEGDPSKPPFFWSCQDPEEAETIKSSIPKDQPLFAFRSLFQKLDKTSKDELAVGLEYARLIQQISLDVPIIIGGFCAGAEIMQFAARQLITDGYKIQAFFSVDYWFDDIFNVPTYHLFSIQRPIKPQVSLNRIENVAARLHPAGFCVKQIDKPHKNMMKTKLSDSIITDLGKIITNDYPFKNPISVKVAEKPEINPKRYHAELRLKAPYFVAPDNTMNIQIIIKNTSELNWPPSLKSGIMLKAQFYNLDNKPRTKEPFWINIDRTLNAGQSTTLDASIPVPNLRLPLKLKISLIEDETVDFEDYNLKPATQIILPLMPRPRNLC